MNVDLFYSDVLGWKTKYKFAKESIMRSIEEFEYRNGYSPDMICMSNQLFSFLIAQSYEERDCIIDYYSDCGYKCFGIKINIFSSDDFEYYLSERGSFWRFK